MRSPAPASARRLVPTVVFLLLLTLAIGLVAASCGLPSSSDESKTRPRAERIGLVLGRQRTASVGDRYGRATTIAVDHTVELLASEDDADGHAARMVLRITEIERGDEWRSTKRYRACWAYRFGPSGLLGGPRPVGCPTGDPLPPPPTTLAPSLDGGSVGRLELALRAMDPADLDDADAVRRAVIAAFAADPDAVVSVARGDDSAAGSVGVAVGAPGGDDCVLARAHPLEAWVPPRVLVQPGEAGCSPTQAAIGGLQHSAH